jgi:hypothetical protein
MNREELKRLWFSLDYSNVKERKQIIVDQCTNPYWPNHAKVQILSEGPNGYKSFSTHQENPLEYAKNRKEYKSGEYELIIK